MIDRLRRLLIKRGKPESDPRPASRRRPQLVVLRGGLAVDAIEPCPIQPRVSVELVAKLCGSMKAGRHEPLLDVEPVPGSADRFRIVCGEQRWRAARQAGLPQVLVRVPRPLGYLQRLEKQYEENRLRAPLDPVEEANCLIVTWNISFPGGGPASTTVPGSPDGGRALDPSRPSTFRILWP